VPVASPSFVGVPDVCTLQGKEESVFLPEEFVPRHFPKRVAERLLPIGRFAAR
jgi:hypothetical protein